MQLPDFTEDTKLNYLRRRVGAPYFNWDSKSKWRSLLEELIAKNELEINIAEDIQVGDDNSLEIEGRKVVAYIRDQHARDPYEATTYKFHIANCRNISEARLGLRLDGRYVASILESDDCIFRINKMHFGKILRRDVRERMDVCKNCLSTLDFDGYSSAPFSRREVIFKSFTVKKYFALYQQGTSVTVPRRSASDADLNMYSADFSEVSRQMKKDAKFRCENIACDNAVGEGNYAALHVHHIDGDKSNNSRRNLKVLCVQCHASEPYHGHMRSFVR